jgi:hypothetical protein
MSDPLLDDLEHVVNVLLAIRTELQRRGDHGGANDVKRSIALLAFIVVQLRREGRLMGADEQVFPGQPELPF